MYFYVQVAFILWGIARKPLLADDPDDEVEFSQRRSTSRSRDSEMEGFQNTAYEISNIGVPSDEVIEDAVAANPDEVTVIEDDVIITDDDEIVPKKTKVTIATDEVFEKDGNVVTMQDTAASDTRNNYESSVSKRRRLDSLTAAAFKRRRMLDEHALQQRIRDHESRSRIKPPNITRLRIRETLMFLLLCNACLWMFWSLESPNIKELAYPNQYYDSTSGGTRNVWNRVTMFCLPLAIFFRMHSCACLFEIWSFA